ncbi:T9SS type A sorting domain-containing protein [Flavihumibacter cheonanensis]|uniref:T9SS type A sorting domain-containing protein n=1 Tax=Flavihumibacter cheonanensis TaxID=1442385 RepID=UPI001EF9967A|nr:T9SS type A sorting domain-containing protein [Flavihumibacter cheonanensis]MCG7751631.1 T9SS type A sorting domain-containing protein [Flavihumibacter cheonanensis]
MGTLIAGNPTFIGLTSGTYKVEIEKGGTCSGNTTVALPQAALTLTPANINPPVCGGNDGSFVVQAGGIIPPYQYLLLKETNGSFVVQEMGTLLAGNPTFIGLTGGTYKVEIEKGGTCSGNTTVALPQAALTLTPANINPPVCGGNDGSFVVQASGIKAPYKYRLLKEVNGNFEVQESGTLIAGNPTFVGLTGGVYKLEVEKNQICSGSITVNLNCETIGTEGCGTGYWKNNKRAWQTTGYSSTQTVESVFNVPDAYGLDNLTLQQALESTGGSGTVGTAKILLRAAVAALLNAAHPDVDYPRSSQQLISSTNTALASGNRNSMLQLATTFDTFNNLKCKLSASKTMASFPGRTSSELTEGSSALNLKAMPNPSAGAFTVLVESNAKEKIYLNVMDMNGRVIERMERMPSTTTFRFGENYSPGMYMVELIQGKERKQVKLVKTR